MDSISPLAASSSRSSNDDVITVISNNNEDRRMTSSIDDIDLDDELIIIETENSVPEVKMQCSGNVEMNSFLLNF